MSGAFSTAYAPAFDVLADETGTDGYDPIGPAVTARGAIVAALMGVPGLQVYATAPDNPVAWDAFPRWAQTDYTSGHLRWLAVHQYDVLVILPAGYEPDTIHEGDSLLDLVAKALIKDVGTVTTAEPIALIFKSAVEMPALRVRVTPRPLNQRGSAKHGR